MHSLLRLLLDWKFPFDLANELVLVADLVALATIPSVLIQRHGRPLAALSWVLALLTVPFGGVFAWWLLGRLHLRRKTLNRRIASAKICQACPTPVENARELPETMQRMLPFAVLDRRWNEGVFPPAMATGMRVLIDGREAFAAISDAIAGARAEIRLLFYIWQVDATGIRLAEQLMDRSHAGVKVRILVDEFGSRAFLRKIAPRLRRAGVEVECFLSRFWKPSWNFRNHRKLLLVDSDLAFTGGMNIGAEYEHDWRDLMLVLRGAVARNLDDVFREDWAFACNETLGEIPGEPGEPGEGIGGLCTVIASGPDRSANRVHDGLFLSACGALARLWLTTPYFIPSPSITTALRTAAQRGVDVRVLLPRLRSWDPLGLAARAHLPELIREGVRVFEFEPRFLHAKSLVVDDHSSFVGSANTDSRSFRLNFELGCFIQSHELNAVLAKSFEADLRQSREIQLEDLLHQSSWQTCLESSAQLLSPLL